MKDCRINVDRSSGRGRRLTIDKLGLQIPTRTTVARVTRWLYCYSIFAHLQMGKSCPKI